MNKDDALQIMQFLEEKGIPYEVRIEIPKEVPSGGTIDPPPPVDETIRVLVTADKAVCRFIKSYNNAGYPMMSIYPSDTSSKGDRQIYYINDIIRVFPEEIRADGGEKFYKLASPVPVIDVELFIQKARVAVMD